jgi:pyridoxal/pyridoxine/pyridoxamine kinase
LENCTVFSGQTFAPMRRIGNSAAALPAAAEFPMRRMGANVWPLNTVQFSNHTQYGHWTGT